MARSEVTTSFTVGFLSRLEEEIEGSINEIGALIVQRITNLAITGRRMIEDGGTGSLPSLSQSYQDVRRGNVSFRTINGEVAPIQGRDPILDTTGRNFRPRSSRSNLTFTGQLLEALQFRFDGRNLTIFMAPTSRNDTNLNNEEVLDLLISRNEGYDIMNLSSSFREEIVNRITRIINEEIVRINT